MAVQVLYCFFPPIIVIQLKLLTCVFFWPDCMHLEIRKMTEETLKILRSQLRFYGL